MTITWKLRESTYEAQIGSRHLTITIWHDGLRPKGDSNPPYLAAVFGARLNMRFDTVEAAKAQAEEVARRLIKKAALEIAEEDSPA